MRDIGYQFMGKYAAYFHVQNKEHGPLYSCHMVVDFVLESTANRFSRLRQRDTGFIKQNMRRDICLTHHTSNCSIYYFVTSY